MSYTEQQTRTDERAAKRERDAAIYASIGAPAHEAEELARLGRLVSKMEAELPGAAGGLTKSAPGYGKATDPKLRAALLAANPRTELKLRAERVHAAAMRAGDRTAAKRAHDAYRAASDLEVAAIERAEAVYGSVT